MTLSGRPHEALVLGAPFVTGATPVVIPTPTWSWLSQGGGNGTFRYKLDDDTLSTGASETTATTFTSPVLTDGSHTLYVQERDALGSWSAIGSWTILVDAPLLAPSVLGISPADVPSATWSWWSQGGGDGTFRYKLDDDTLSIGASETTETTFTSPVLMNGPHTLYVQERDALGNWSAIGSWTILVDAPLLAPSSVIGSLDPITDKPKWTWQSGGGGIGTYRYALDDASGPTTEIMGTTLVLTGDVATQDHTLFVQEKDDNGNWSEMSSAVSRAIAYLPPTLGDYRTCVVLGNGKVKCWGGNEEGRLGIGHTRDTGDGPNEMGANLPSVTLGTGRTVEQFGMGANHACSILDNRAAKCWGANSYGQLGFQGWTIGSMLSQMGDALLAIPFGSNGTVTAISAQGVATCGLLNTGTLTCWGGNNAGNLGLGDTNLRTSPENLPGVNLGTGKTAQQVVVGNDFVCAILNTGDLKCWGSNSNGQLGHNNTADPIGIDLSQMGDNLKPTFLGEGRTATAVALGALHTCALLDDHSIKCWGYGPVLGLEKNRSYGRSAGDMESLPSVNLGDDFIPVNISTLRLHTCAISSDGRVRCWGQNVQGQLGIGDISGRNAFIGDQPDEMGNKLLAIDFGKDSSDTPYRATSISVGYYHTCALLNNGALKCWGDNSRGQLGIGDISDNKATIGDQPGEMGNALQSVSLY